MLARSRGSTSANEGNWTRHAVCLCFALSLTKLACLTLFASASRTVKQGEKLYLLRQSHG